MKFLLALILTFGFSSISQASVEETYRYAINNISAGRDRLDMHGGMWRLHVNLICADTEMGKSTIEYEEAKGKMNTREIDVETCKTLIEKLINADENNPMDLVIKENGTKFEVSHTYTYR